jgi:ribonuclease HII
MESTNKTLQKKFHDFANKKLAEKETRKTRKKAPRNSKEPLKPRYHEDNTELLECGIDEAGRGPLFGRVYAACVILPLNGFDHSKIKDSKRFSSKKKLIEVYDYIIENAVDYSVSYNDESVIDDINIRQATLSCMHDAIDRIGIKPDFLLVDGCDFKPYKDIPYKTIEGGDNWYTPIAAASILAKVERDKYIEQLCEEHPELDEKYGLVKNKGYGTKQHLDGIKEHGISIWHRRTFGICRRFSGLDKEE